MKWENETNKKTRNKQIKFMRVYLLFFFKFGFDK